MPDDRDTVYLDAAASTPMHPDAAEAARQAFERYGDPRSRHSQGRSALALLESSRGAVARGLGAQPDEVVFVSGGSEANALAIRGTVEALDRTDTRRIVLTALAHPSVLGAAEATGLEIVEVPVDGGGRVDVDRWAVETAHVGTALASIPHADHLVGTIQPVAECIRLGRERGVTVHVDACQSVGVLPIDVTALGADLLSVSGHKAYGPAGVGALVVRRGVEVRGLIGGERRERGLRGGHPNLPGIAGMAAAIEAIRPEIGDVAARLWTLTARLRTGLEGAEGIRVLGHETQRAPHIVSWTAAGLDGETLSMALEDRGIQVGGWPVHDLERAGLASAGEVVVRMGLTRSTTEDDVERVLRIAPPLVRDLRAIAEQADASFPGARGSGRFG